MHHPQLKQQPQQPPSRSSWSPSSSTARCQRRSGQLSSCPRHPESSSVRTVLQASPALWSPSSRLRSSFALLALFALGLSLLPSVVVNAAQLHMVETSTMDPPMFVNPPTKLNMFDAMQFILHNVHGIAFAASQADYDNCVPSTGEKLPTAAPIAEMSPPIIFDKGPGMFYVLSSVPDQCQKGMKFIVEVTAQGAAATTSMTTTTQKMEGEMKTTATMTGSMTTSTKMEGGGAMPGGGEKGTPMPTPAAGKENQQPAGAAEVVTSLLTKEKNGASTVTANLVWSALLGLATTCAVALLGA
ncbi:hypothetical protein DFJ73DRAFT_221327 [Zopfochytrium polystomum]|nr:hypothetical protein DFJ73DRAFT_221327 [Zopfochytrium polystomum]